MANVDIIDAQDRFELSEENGEVWIVDHIAVIGQDYIAPEASFARFISEFRRSFPDIPFALAMQVTFLPPPHTAENPDLFRIAVRFNATRNALRIDPAWLTTGSEFEPGHAYAFGIFTRHADGLREILERSDRFSDQVEAALDVGHASSSQFKRIYGQSRRQ